ncbi:hypothetical protein [Phormidium nigroviride]
MFWDKKTELRHRVVVETEEITTHKFNAYKFASFVLAAFLLLSLVFNRGHSSNNYQPRDANPSVIEDTNNIQVEEEIQ